MKDALFEDWNSDELSPAYHLKTVIMQDAYNL